MNCDQALELLSAELDGELSAQEHKALQAHLASCAECRAVFQAMKDVDGLLADTQLEPPAALHDNVMREVRADAVQKAQRKRLAPVSIIAAAAVAALALSAAGLIEMPGFSRKHQSTVSLHEVVEAFFPSAQSEEHDSAVADAYAKENNCAVLAIWDCTGLPELTGRFSDLSDGGRLYSVDAATLESLLKHYSGLYAMESYTPDTEATCAAVVLYR